MMNPRARIEHTALEVQDGDRGWVLFDLLFGGTVTTPTGGCAAAATENPNTIRFDPIALPPRNVRDHRKGRQFYQGTPGKPRSTHLLDPDPWLYSRVGHRWAVWPFSARYVLAGTATWCLGAGQRVLRCHPPDRIGSDEPAQASGRAARGGSATI
jgi:hypothetical protein